MCTQTVAVARAAVTAMKVAAWVAVALEEGFPAAAAVGRTAAVVAVSVAHHLEVRVEGTRTEKCPPLVVRPRGSGNRQTFFRAHVAPSEGYLRVE